MRSCCFGARTITAPFGNVCRRYTVATSRERLWIAKRDVRTWVVTAGVTAEGVVVAAVAASLVPRAVIPISTAAITGRGAMPNS